MATTPVVMKVQDYKDREVQMVSYEFDHKFTGGYCVDFEENWADKEGHYEEIVISCQNIEVGSVKFENAWA